MAEFPRTCDAWLLQLAATVQVKEQLGYESYPCSQDPQSLDAFTPTGHTLQSRLVHCFRHTQEQFGKSPDAEIA